MLTRVRAVRAQSDRGIGLIELLVGSGLLIVVSTLAMFFLNGTMAQSNRVTAQTLDNGDLRVALDRIAGELRLADSPTARPGTVVGRFETLAANRIVFYANVASDSRAGYYGRTPPVKIDISVIGDQLVERTYAPKTKYATVPSTAPTAMPTPTYTPTPYPTNADGSDAYSYPTNYPSSGSDGTTADRPSARRVLVSGLANTSSSATPPVFSYCSAATDPTTSCTKAANATTVSAVVVNLVVTPTPGAAAQNATTTIAITGAVAS